jgi:hypothetical protein
MYRMYVIHKIDGRTRAKIHDDDLGFKDLVFDPDDSKVVSYLWPEPMDMLLTAYWEVPALRSPEKDKDLLEWLEKQYVGIDPSSVMQDWERCAGPYYLHENAEKHLFYGVLRETLLKWVDDEPPLKLWESYERNIKDVIGSSEYRRRRVGQMIDGALECFGDELIDRFYEFGRSME